MRVLITGATGFLGGAVTRHFVRQGHDVLGTGRNVSRGAELRDLGALFEPGDLDDPSLAQAVCRGRDWVVHCAALSSPWGSYDRFYRANVLATRNLVAAARTANVQRFVHVSTPSLYVDGRHRIHVREDAQLPPPVNAYAATKKLAEDEVRAAEKLGLSALILRPRALFGPGDATIFPRLLRALETGRLPVIGRGDNQVDLTYIDNAVQAVERACYAPMHCTGRVYNVTNGAPVALWPLIRSLAERLALPAPRGRVPYPVALAAAKVVEALHRRLRLGEPRITAYGVQTLALTMTLDISAARRDLGYAPGVSIEEGLTRFVTWWKEQT